MTFSARTGLGISCTSVSAPPLALIVHSRVPWGLLWVLPRGLGSSVSISPVVHSSVITVPASSPKCLDMRRVDTASKGEDLPEEPSGKIIPGPG